MTLDEIERIVRRGNFFDYPVMRDALLALVMTARAAQKMDHNYDCNQVTVFSHPEQVMLSERLRCDCGYDALRAALEGVTA